MKRQDIINKLMLMSDKDVNRILNSIFAYENIEFSFDMFLNATPTYSVHFTNPVTKKEDTWVEPLRLRHAIPDYMIDNFTTFRREDTKMMTDFVRIFLARIFSLNTLFTIKRNQNLYLSPLKGYQYSVSTINNRKNIEYFFKNFFTRKVQIIENIPERAPNFNQFILGKSVIRAKYTDHMSVIGNFVFTSLHKYQVLLDLDFNELEDLQNCVWALKKTEITILKSTENPKIKKRYYFCLSFVGTALKGIHSYFPNEVSYA